MQGRPIFNVAWCVCVKVLATRALLFSARAPPQRKLRKWRSDIHLPCVEILQLHEFFARGAIRARAAIMFHQPGSLTVSAVRFGSICRSFGCPRLGCLPVLDPRDFGAHSRATPSAVAEWREL